MSTTFRPYAPDQMLLLPADLRAWLPEGHLAHHVSDQRWTRNSDSLLRWDPDPGEGVWHATEETELSG